VILGRFVKGVGIAKVTCSTCFYRILRWLGFFLVWRVLGSLVWLITMWGEFIVSDS